MYEYIFPDFEDFENDTIKFEVRYNDAKWKFLSGTDQALRQEEWESDGESVRNGFPSWFHAAFSDEYTEKVETDG